MSDDDDTPTLVRENARLRAELAQLRAERDRLRVQLAEIDRDRLSVAQKYREAEQQTSHLANLYVASYRLNASLDREEVLRSIQEILINLVGTEELAIFEVDARQQKLELVASVGIEAARYATLSLDAESAIARAARRGEAVIATQGQSLPEDSRLTACIPLQIADRVVGAIAVFRLLPQKERLQPVDHELFDLLRSHAAVALYSSQLAARAAE
jgi:nitrate/nitrite-specific signal transduction histidine kinase